jgi:hypothetical protein
LRFLDERRAFSERALSRRVFSGQAAGSTLFLGLGFLDWRAGHTLPAENTFAHDRTGQRWEEAAYFHVRKLGYEKLAELPVSRAPGKWTLIGVIWRCSVLSGGQDADYARCEAR